MAVVVDYQQKQHYVEGCFLGVKQLRFICKSIVFGSMLVWIIISTFKTGGWLVNDRNQEGNVENILDHSNGGRTSLSTTRKLLMINFSLPDANEINECSYIHKLNNEQKNNQTILCEFVRNVPACKSDGGFIPYFEFVYCVMPLKLLPLSMILLFVWLLFLFMFLGTTAEEYFCPALTVISQVLHLSQNVAGVTLLAFGNGAPDIFSALAAINQPDIKRASLAFGALFGAGMFVTTVVVGAVVVSKPFTLTRRPYMRDLIFYLAAVYWTFFVLWENRMSIWISLGFIMMYFAYVVVVILGRIIYQKWKKKVLGTGDIPKPQSKPVGREMATSTSAQYVVISNGDVGTTDENGRVDIPRDENESPPPPKEEVVTRPPTVIVVDTSDDKEISGRHKVVKIEDDDHEHHSMTPRERCASRASQSVYGVSDEEDEEKDRIPSPIPRSTHGTGTSPRSSPRRIRRTISGALDITEDVGLVAVGANPNLSKIWHHAYRREITHNPRGSPRLGDSSLHQPSPHLRPKSPSYISDISVSYKREDPQTIDVESTTDENELTEEEEQPLLTVSPEFETPRTYHPFVKLLIALWPFGEAFKQLRFYGKIYEIFKSPAGLLLTLTVPVIDREEDNDNWNRWLNILQCVTAPLFISLTTKVGLKMIGGVFPGIGFALIFGVILAILIAFTSSNDKPPRYHCVFAWLGFAVAIIWIYSIANEIVNLLQVFGIVIKISDGILGITLLAWGNSIGDAVANVTMARQGFPRMAIGACFGGPLLNMLLGIGIASTIKAIRQPGHSFGLYFTEVQMFAALFLLLSLSSSLVITSCLRFKMRRLYGICLFIFYVIFLLVVILAEAHVFNIQIDGVLEPLF